MHRYCRQISLILAALYLLTGSGLGTLILQGASQTYASVVFPCKGKNCACDDAGYELKGCRCVHDDTSQEVSCCSVKKPSSPENTKTNSQGSILSNADCGGFSDDGDHSLAKHIHLSPHEIGPFYLCHTSQYSSSSVYLQSWLTLPLDKVPIFS